MSSTIEEVAKVLHVITELEARLAELRGLLAAKGKKGKKVRDPGKPKREPNAWIKFTQRVEGVLKGAEKGFGRVVTSKQFCKSLKDKKVYAEWLDEEILAERSIWEPPSPVHVIAGDAEVEAGAEAKPCPVCKEDVYANDAQAHRTCIVAFATEAEARGEDPMKAVDTWKEAVTPEAPPRHHSLTTSSIKPLRALTLSARRLSSVRDSHPTHPITFLGPATQILPGELVLEEFEE